MDVNKLCEQDLVNETFSPIREKHSVFPEDIGMIEFAFKNAHYNNNRLIEELKRSRSGFGFPDKESALKVAKQIGLKKGKKLEIGIPMTVWTDILFFEFHSCLYNIVRCINFLIEFKLKHIEKQILDRYPSIAQYTHSRNQNKYEKQKDYELLKQAYEDWIKNLNKIRNDVSHNYPTIIKKSTCEMLIRYRLPEENEVLIEGDIINFAIPDYKIKNIEEFLETSLSHLKKLLLKVLTA